MSVMEQAVEAAHVDERAVVGEVLDDAGEDALFEVLEGDGLLGVLLLFENLLAERATLPRFLLGFDDPGLRHPGV